MGLLANQIEAAGVTTLMIGTVLDVMVETRAPRAVFVDFPVGRTFGRPAAGSQHAEVLAAALAELPRFTQAGEVRALPLTWDASGDRSWEQMVRDELLRYRPPGPG